MYFDQLHKEIPINSSTNVFEKFFWVGFGFSNFFRVLETTKFFFFLGLFERLLYAWTYVFCSITQGNIQKFQYQCPRKKFLCRFQVLEFFSSTRNDQIFLISRALRETFICINLCILIKYTRIYPKIPVLMSSKKVFWVGFRFSNFFRVLETNKFFFF